MKSTCHLQDLLGNPEPLPRYVLTYEGKYHLTGIENNSKSIGFFTRKLPQAWVFDYEPLNGSIEVFKYGPRCITATNIRKWFQEEELIEIQVAEILWGEMLKAWTFRGIAIF